MKPACRYCGTDYQDPKYCSVFGRTADEHVFTEGECDCFFKGESLDGKGTPKGKIICGCQCHISHENVFEEKVLLCGCKNNCTCGLDILEVTSILNHGQNKVSERNALIDEMIKEVECVDSVNLYDGDGETHTGWEQAKEHIVNLLKSKKK
jgi:hypothetical protein